MALSTFGEGYHNFHHEFQSDYRNGVKAWQFDPTKWTIWGLNKLGLATDLRRVPEERIVRAEINEHHRAIAERIDHYSLEVPESLQTLWNSAHDRVQEAVSNWEDQKKLYTATARKQVEESSKKLDELRSRVSEATKQMRQAMEEWREAQREIHQQLSLLANGGAAA